MSMGKGENKLYPESSPQYTKNKTDKEEKLERRRLKKKKWKSFSLYKYIFVLMRSGVCVLFLIHSADVDETMMSFYFYSRLQSVVIVIVVFIIACNTKYMDLGTHIRVFVHNTSTQTWFIVMVQWKAASSADIICECVWVYMWVWDCLTYQHSFLFFIIISSVFCCVALLPFSYVYHTDYIVAIEFYFIFIHIFVVGFECLMYFAFDSNMLKSKMLFVSSFSSQLEVNKPLCSFARWNNL